MAKKKSFGVNNSKFMGERLKSSSALNSSLKETGKQEVFNKISIHPDLQSYIAPLSAEEFGMLESNIVKTKKVRDPLLLWKFSEEHFYLLDGHHRFQVLKANPKAELDWSYQLINLESKDKAFELMEEIQLGRRNASRNYISYLRGRSYLREKQTHGGARQAENASGAKTIQLVAERFKVGERTIHRDAYFAKGVDRFLDKKLSEAIQQERKRILSNESKLPKAEVAFLGQYEELKLEDYLEYLSQGGQAALLEEVAPENWNDFVARFGSKAAVEPEQPKAASPAKPKADRFQTWVKQEEKQIQRLVKSGDDQAKKHKAREIQSRMEELERLLKELQ